MTERKLCGFDINGWRDFAAKNWRSIPGEEEELGPADIVPSGPLSSVVQIGEGKGERWIGGPQADSAPHGLGGGWGDVGRHERRVYVRALLEMRDQDPTRLSAAYEGSARGAAFNTVSIDEGQSGSEAVQEHLLGSLAGGKFRNAALVWRPVLAALYAIDQGFVAEGQRIGVVCQDQHGLSVQKLLVRDARGVLAPERRTAASHTECDFGYENLVHHARTEAIGADRLTSRTAHRAIAKSVGRAALGIECQPEMLRLQNGDWDLLDMSGFDIAAGLIGPTSGVVLLGCDVVLVESLAEGRLKDRLVSFINGIRPGSVIPLPATAVALGALVAAQRASDGKPIYFDFLPRLSTIVYGVDGPITFDLVRSNETLEAGRTYRSPVPAKLAIPSGQGSVSVYLDKEAALRPRKATVAIGRPFADQVEVSLWVEQKPAAGRAKIYMEARDVGRNFTIDWDEAPEDERSWDEIVQSLESPVSIPKRLVLPCGLPAWEESNRSEALFEILKTETERQAIDWETLAAKLSARPFGQNCISSDGELPLEVGKDDLDRLNVLTERALNVTRKRLQGETGLGTADNSALKFLTWQFRRCPAEVVDWLLDCVESKDRPHPFVRHHASWVLVYQGLGRIVSGEETERRVMQLLLSSDIKQWSWREQTACVAFLLSRSDSAPLLLERRDVEMLAQRTLQEFRSNIGSEYTTFNYAPFLLAGLLRWRLKEPRALLMGVDPIANELSAVLAEVEGDLVNQRRLTENLRRRRDKFLPILRDLKAELVGEGANPDLLLDIYGASRG